MGAHIERNTVIPFASYDIPHDVDSVKLEGKLPDKKLVFISNKTEIFIILFLSK